MSIFMNTRRSGTASGHITAQLEALANEALIGSGNYVFNVGDKFAIVITPTNGTVTVSSGIFSWSGRLGGIETSESIKYTPPESETLYKKVIICAKYSKNITALTEEISLAVIASENQTSESAAENFNLDTGSNEITAETETAYFPLWEFIASLKSHTTPTQKFNYVENLSSLQKSTNTLATNIKNEETARTAKDTDLDTRLTKIEERCELIASDVTYNRVSDIETSKYRAFVLMIQVRKDSTRLTPLTIPALKGAYYHPQYAFTERTLGSFDVTTVDSYAYVSDTSVTFECDDASNWGRFKKLYGIM